MVVWVLYTTVLSMVERAVVVGEADFHFDEQRKDE